MLGGSLTAINANVHWAVGFSGLLARLGSPATERRHTSGVYASPAAQVRCTHILRELSRRTFNVRGCQMVSTSVSLVLEGFGVITSRLQHLAVLRGSSAPEIYEQRSDRFDASTSFPPATNTS